MVESSEMPIGPSEESVPPSEESVLPSDGSVLPSGTARLAVQGCGVRTRRSGGQEGGRIVR